LIGVYFIVNKCNGKIYVGSSINIRNRFSVHKYYLRHKKHDNKFLQSDWDKYGEHSFEFNIVEESNSKEESTDRENYYIKLLNVCDKSIGYNIHENAESPLGYRFSEESKAKISERVSGEGNPFYGMEHKVESKQKWENQK